jgi:transposase-like protein
MSLEDRGSGANTGTPVEETDYECPRCLSRYVLVVSIQTVGGEDPTFAKDFACPKCGRYASEFRPNGLAGALIAYRRRE